ncbi:MAG TPA: cytochrome c [Candidatus Acidoferrales bacterium]|nr:cytochrome c [Candidatus Acidoferrales bacterium]
MKLNWLLFPIGALALAVLIAPYGARAQDGNLVARGRYLVVMAGKCSDCHGEHLQGAALDFLNPNLPPIVRRRAPRIAGLPQLSRQAAIRFLHTGLLPNGHPARPPMPQYNFNVADATAIVAYLKSLP